MLRTNVFKGLVPLLVLLAVAAGGSACSKQEARYAGTWKGNCSDYWGILIRPADGDLYSVTFCGLSGCLAPGEWTADTRIDGDPMYEVLSAGRIRIKRTDSGYFTYTRCSDSRSWKRANQ